MRGEKKRGRRERKEEQREREREKEKVEIIFFCGPFHELTIDEYISEKLKIRSNWFAVHLSS